MIARLVVALGVFLPQEAAPWKRALDAGDFSGAWAASENEREGLEARIARAEILYRAGDPAGALSQAEDGLRGSPDRLELLYHAAGSAIWIEDLSRAAEYSTRLKRAVDHGVTRLDPDQQLAWDRAAQRFLELSRDLSRASEERTHTIHRARTLALGTLAGVLVLATWVARGYGRSSSPVS